MMKYLSFLALICAFSAAQAEIVEPRRTIRAGEVIEAADLALRRGVASGAAGAIAEVAGMEARVTLYRGRAIRSDDIGTPALIARNQLVTIIFRSGRLSISAEGRALGRGVVGGALKVMNLASRQTLVGKVLPDGRVVVQ